MNTEITATPPDALPGSNIQTVDFSPEAKQLHRKIAKLPKPLRDIINSSLDDALPAKEIIQKLEASTNPPLPYPISEANLSRWKTTGYQRYLAHQDHLDSIEASREAALEMVASNNNLSLPQATLHVIAGQCFEVLAEFSPAAVKQKLAEDPLKYTSFLHVFARLTREMVHLEKFVEARAAAQAEKSDPNRDKEADAAEFWTRHTRSLFNRKNPHAIKFSSSSSSSSNSSPSAPPGEMAASPPSHDSNITHQDQPSHSSPASHPPHESPITQHDSAHSSHPASCIEPLASAPSPIENPKSKIENPLVPATTTSQILEEYCLDCRHPLPPLTPEGKRPDERCAHCNILLPPPGTCTRPSSDKCHLCGTTLPHRLPSGRRPKPACHNCGVHLGRELDEDIKKYAEE